MEVLTVMADEKNIDSGEEEFDEAEEVEVYTLIDEDGQECQFECVGRYDDNGVQYFAMLPFEEKEADEYVILKLETDDDGEEVLVSVDDDEEFDKIAGIFDRMLFDEIDYDEE